MVVPVTAWIPLLLLAVLGLAAWRVVERQRVPHDGRNPVDLGDAIGELARRGRGV